MRRRIIMKDSIVGEEMAKLELTYRRSGRGRPLLLLHGWCLNRRLWVYAEEALGDAFDIISPDLAGFGESAHLPGPYTLGRYADNLEKLILALGIEKPVVVGFAFGAAVAVELAGRPNAPAAGVVSIGIPSAAASPYDKMPVSMRQDWPDFAFRSAAALFHARPSDATLRWLEAMFSATELSVALDVLSILATYEPAEVVGRVSVPQLFLHAANDRVSPVKTGEACVKVAPKAEMKVLGTGGHLIPIEQKHALHAAIRAFSQTLPAK
jgi:non-heme chloroperoxidase